MTAKPKRIKPTDAEVLDRRAQAAWEYRQRHRAAVNEKARLRMQKRREALKHASSDVQQQATQKARQYRQRYNERARAASQPHAEYEKTSTKATGPTGRQQLSKAPQPIARAANPRPPIAAPALPPALRHAPSPFRSSPGKLADLNLVKPRSPRGSIDRSSPPPTPTPQSRNHQQRTPKSLVAIDAEDSPGEETDEEKSDADEPAYTGHRITSIHRWWEYLDADGPLLNITGHPDYVPEHGQQPYIKGGRRYWF
ncbi:hypothetical protein C8F04DRAFT_1179971 [Mycena alexandri]|uniref:Uncharacterized protein n=1 Tax=Mycena alexandri TaxID=1745969 RepID=A0AAD6XAP6_9AGAR|nr:hypothetical protein C8F04DRAFT_1179971 [Mycena alexandri]